MSEEPIKSSPLEQTDAQTVSSKTGIETLSWVSHPFTRSRGKSVIAVSAVCLSVIVGGWYLESYLFGALAGLVMFGSLTKFFLPTKYTFDDEGVTVKTTTQTFTRPWTMFRSFYTDRNGVLLSPFMAPSRLENFRGLYLTFDNNRDEVLNFVRTHVIPPAGIDDHAPRSN